MNTTNETTKDSAKSTVQRKSRGAHTRMVLEESSGPIAAARLAAAKLLGMLYERFGEDDDEYERAPMFDELGVIVKELTAVAQIIDDACDSLPSVKLKLAAPEGSAEPFAELAQGGAA